MTTIENTIEDIAMMNIGSEDSKNSKSRIIIRDSKGLLRGILAEVDCGNCNNHYKQKLVYLYGNFSIENEELVCTWCGYTDFISYRKDKVHYD